MPLFASLVFFVTLRWQAQKRCNRATFETRVHPYEHVLEQGLVGEQANVLEGPANAPGSDLMWAQAVKGLAIENDPPG